MTVRAARRIPDLQPGTPAFRVLGRVTPGVGGCWLWTGSVDRKGYGQIWVAGRLPMVHRVVFEATVAAIPEGREVDHLCRVRRCVRPGHLEAVTHRVNVLRGSSPAALPHNRGICQRSHDWAAHSVPNGKFRTCGACKRERRAA